MVIDQRNAGASVTPTNAAYTLDRWQATMFANTGKFSVQQNAGSVTPPAGFINYLGVTSLSSYSTSGNDIYSINQTIEGYNIADLNWGTANAKTITISFWVRSSLTGTFAAGLSNDTRSYPFTYTISAANTWEQKSVTVAGDTSGTWGSTNAIGVALRFGLGAGASSTFTGPAGAWASANYYVATGGTSVVGTSGATFYITGVQLEAGTTASPFEYRQYGTELQLCQRYFQRTTFDTGDYPLGFAYAYSNNTCASSLALAVPMRAQPTAAIVVNMGIRGGGFSTSQTLSSLGAISFSNGIGSGLYVLCNPTTSGSSLTSYTTYLLSNIASGGFTLSAEL
jgi:hypothetical protein